MLKKSTKRNWFLKRILIGFSLMVLGVQRLLPEHDYQLNHSESSPTWAISSPDHEFVFHRLEQSCCTSQHQRGVGERSLLES